MPSKLEKRSHSGIYQSEVLKSKTKKQAQTVSTPDSSPTINLDLAVYIPESGNLYHWAFCTLDNKTSTVFDVAQERQDGPFTPLRREINPLHSLRCLRPLISLGTLHRGWWDTLVENITYIPVPGESHYWNCQDYVIEIWEMMYTNGMIDMETYDRGKVNMRPYYGPDAGGKQDSNVDEVEDDGANDDGDGEQDGDEEDHRNDGYEGRQALSAEFVIDSSESDC